MLFSPCPPDNFCYLFSRVRIEVLRALASKVTSSQLLTYCVSNGPRPKLSVGPAVGYPGRRVAHFYTEALKRYGYLLEESVLEKAYDRAQMFFTGALLFILLVIMFGFTYFICVFFFLGELETTFLVLREKSAIKRLKAREAARGPQQAQPAAPEPPPTRGLKRGASTEASTPSKR